MTTVVLALIQDGARYFLQRRDPAGAVLPGFWEFPGGKVEAGESLLEALSRELREELDVSVVEARTMASLPGNPVLEPFHVRIQGRPHTDLAWGWFLPEEMHRLPVPPRNLELIRRIQDAKALRASL